MSIEVISDPAHVAAAREAYRRRTEHDLLELLKRPSNIDLSARGRERLRANRQRVVDAMTRLRDNPQQDPRRPLFAMIVLETYTEPIDENGTGSYAGAVRPRRARVPLPPVGPLHGDGSRRPRRLREPRARRRGARERFIRIAPDAVFAHYAFADPDAFQKAAKELNIPVVEPHSY